MYTLRGEILFECLDFFWAIKAWSVVPYGDVDAVQRTQAGFGDALQGCAFGEWAIICDDKNGKIHENTLYRAFCRAHTEPQGRGGSFLLLPRESVNVLSWLGALWLLAI